MVLKNDNNMLLKDRVVECVVAHENVAHENTFFWKNKHTFLQRTSFNGLFGDVQSCVLARPRQTCEDTCC